MGGRKCDALATISFRAGGHGRRHSLRRRGRRASAAPSEGQKLVTQHCDHATRSRAANFGNVGPSLIDLKARYPDRKEVAAIIFDETKRNPQTVMLPFGRNLILTNKEIETIVDFLYTQ